MRIANLLLLTASLAMAVEPVPLSLKRAVEVAISPEGSARIQLADEAVKQAQARALEQRAALLPNVDAAFSDQSRTENLAALGFNPAIFSTKASLRSAESGSVTLSPTASCFGSALHRLKPGFSA